jgi:uncharacterized protein YqfA (UPF0365 family)
VRANIDRLVGGAGEETIIARVGEGIVTTIGSSDDPQDRAGKSRHDLADSVGTRVLMRGPPLKSSP